MRFSDQSNLFQKQACNGFENARCKLFSQGKSTFKTYFNDSAQRKALTYPFAHAGQSVQNVVSIFYGIYLFGKSVATLQFPTAALTIILATLIQCISLLLNACNILISLCSLASRALVTAVNGYEFETKYIQKSDSTSESGIISSSLNDLEIGYERYQMTPRQKEAEKQEDENYKLAFTFV